MIIHAIRLMTLSEWPRFVELAGRLADNMAVRPLAR